MIYLIRNRQTKQPIRISTYSNEGSDFCESVGAKFELSDFDRTIYAVPSAAWAIRALERDPKWYNSSTEHPEWPEGFDPNQWEVFAVDIG